MDFGIAIDLAGRRLQQPAFEAVGEVEHVDGAEDRGLGRLHRIVLVVHRRGRTGEIVDLVDLDAQRLGDVVADQLELRRAEMMLDVAFGAGEEIVDADDLVAIGNQPIDEMRAEKPGATGDQDPSATLVDARHECSTAGNRPARAGRSRRPLPVNSLPSAATSARPAWRRPPMPMPK